MRGICERKRPEGLEVGRPGASLLSTLKRTKDPRYDTPVPGRFLYYGEILIRLLPQDDYARHLEALAEALPIEVAATDAQGRVIVWNASMARVAGPRDEVLGRPLLDALPVLGHDTNTNWHQVLQTVLRGGAPRTFARVPLAGRVVRATVAPMRGADQRVLGAVLALEDITRGARDAEERLRQERAHAVHSLGAGIAHELRNPLNALSLNLQLLVERLESEAMAPGEILERLTRMLHETQRVENLIGHLLEVSRQGALRSGVVALDPLVAEVVARLEGMARALGCEMHFDGSSRRELPLDRVRIERALHNLLRNGIEAAAEGGGHVWVSTRDDPHSTVIVIDDDGPGIRPEDRSSVFVLYSTGKRGGTGLGLPLAREDVLRHGGEIEVLSRPGGGARFVVHLPIEPATNAGRTEQEEGASPWHTS